MPLEAFWQDVLPTPDSFAFDPKTLYDPYSNRWITTAMADARESSSAVMVGVSATDDPGGDWNLYSLDADPSDIVWADYPSLGFNKDWIVIGVNMFEIYPGYFVRTNLYIFDKAGLASTGSGDHTLIELDGIFGMVPSATYDPTHSTIYIVEEWQPSAGTLRFSKITGGVGSEILTTDIAFPSGPPWGIGGNWVTPQLGTDEEFLDANDSRILNCIFRNNAIWCVHTTFPLTGPSGPIMAQWWKLSTSGVVLDRGLIGDSTAAHCYTFPSIAVNKNDDALIGYSCFSFTQYASACYSYRSSSDPPGTFRDSRMLKEGEDIYYQYPGSVINRWGDYSNTVVDPVNDTDFWTIQEYAALRGSGEGRWSTWWGKIVPPSSGAPSTDLAVSLSGLPTSVLEGQNFSYTATVINQGPASAAEAALTHDLPSSTVLVSAVASQGTCNSSGPIICDLGPLNSGQSATVDFTVRRNTPGPYQVTVQVSHDGNDPDSSDNSDTQTVTVDPLPDTNLSASFGIPPSSAVAGQNSTYTVIVSNSGPAPAENTLLVHSLPGEATLISASASPSGSCGNSFPLSCNLGILPVGGTRTITFVIRPDAASSYNATITVSHESNDPNLADNSLSVSYSATQGPPVVTSLFPPSTVAGSPGFTLDVYGSAFVNGTSTVQWNGQSRSTAFISSTHLQASILASDVSATQTANVTVTTPGWGTSGPAYFQVRAPQPYLYALTPSNATEGGAAFTLRITGTNFANGTSVVKWDNVSKPTVFISATILEAQIDANDITVARPLLIRVDNGPSNGGLSNGLLFTVSPPGGPGGCQISGEKKTNPILVIIASISFLIFWRHQRNRGIARSVS